MTIHSLIHFDREYRRVLRVCLDDCRRIGQSEVAEDLREDVSNEVHDERIEGRAA